MKTVLIDPKEQTIKEITIDNFDKETFKWAYPLLDCDLVEIVRLDRRTVLVIDEEGLLKPNFFFHFEDIPHLKGNPFAGKAIIMIEDGHGDLRGLNERELFAALLTSMKLVKFDGDDLAADRAMASGVLQRPQSSIRGMDDNFQPKGEKTVTWQWTPNVPLDPTN